jgi:hypothetical protein
VTQPNDVFRSLSEEECQALLREMRDELKPVYKQVERAAAATLRVRPVFLSKQPFPKRCEMIRKAMSLKINAEAAGEVLAAFFMERYAEDLRELLDAFGVEHEEGVLKAPAPKEPAASVVKKTVAKFPQGKHATMRSVLLRAFAAQTAVDWPALDAIVFPEATAAAS